LLFQNYLCTGTNHERYRYNFNYGWKLLIADIEDAEKQRFDDSSWKNISLPYAWNGDEAFRYDIKDLSTGIAWYRKHFKLSGELTGKKVFIEFEGVRQAAEVYVNGQYAGLHENGITAFGYDITNLVKFGNHDNVVAVRTDNSWDYEEKSSGIKFQWNDRNFNANYGGIPKNVVLHVTGKVYQTLPLYTNLKTTGQYIYARDIDTREKSAMVTVETQVINELDKTIEINYEVKIEDLEGKLVKEMDGGTYKLASGEIRVLSISGKMEDLYFWSWGYGYLYKVHTLLKQGDEIIDQVTTRTGFRKTEFADGLVKLNDRVIMIKGYAQRTSNEWPAVGMSVPPWLSDYSNKLMVESNANLVRWMHVAPWKQDVESCDRVGLMQAMPAGDSEKDKEGRQWDQRVEVMRDAIIYYRNNPSIIFYECGNNDISEEHMQEMKDLRDKYDYYGGRAIGSRNMLDSEVAEYGGEMLYINKSSTKPVWAMEYMRDEGLRKYWDEYSPPYHKNGEGPLYKGRDASAYNQNQDSYAYQAVKRWYDYYRERPGTGHRVSSGGVNIIFSETNTHHRGEENYRRSGEVDALRIPKDAFFAHKVIWNGWVDIEEQGTNIVGHWNYKEGVVKNIYVVSSGEKVELLVNGKSVGFGKRIFNFMFTFDSIAWEAGKIEARSYNEKGRLLSSDIIKTAGKPEAVKLTLIHDSNGLLANGADLALIEAEVVDYEGNRNPIALNILEFELDGAAEWRGGMAQGPDNYILSKKLPVECGVNRILVRSLTIPGKIKVIARSDGLKPDTIVFESRPVEIENGLSLNFPSENLPVNLEKGPTPKSISYRVSRKSVKIVDAKAGSNQESVGNSFDGKQTTRWVNDGNLETGWIEYTLEKKARIDEIALKLSGWRTRSYPIVVTAKDSIIYMGITEPNLGFFYIKPDWPVITDRLKIRLFGQSEFNDVYKLVEITGKPDKETANDMAVKNPGSLNIVEIEVFEKL
jgi:hypothetical protein